MKPNTLTPDLLRKMDAYWRAANYLSVGQIHLCDNPLLKRPLTLANDRYKSGMDSYLDVITTQITLLSNQRTAMNLRMQQMTASVQLIKALGGGWNVSHGTTAAIP